MYLFADTSCVGFVMTQTGWMEVGWWKPGGKPQANERKCTKTTGVHKSAIFFLFAAVCPCLYRFLFFFLLPVGCHEVQFHASIPHTTIFHKDPCLSVEHQNCVNCNEAPGVCTLCETFA